MPEPDHTTVDKDGYQITFHPAFASRCAVQRVGGPEVELYRQQGVHQHPAGQTHPTAHVVQLRGGSDGRELTLRIEDPRSHIARIVVELYAQGHEPGWGTPEESVETLTITNNTVECPPNCDG